MSRKIFSFILILCLLLVLVPFPAEAANDEPAAETSQIVVVLELEAVGSLAEPVAPTEPTVAEPASVPAEPATAPEAQADAEPASASTELTGAEPAAPAEPSEAGTVETEPTAPEVNAAPAEPAETQTAEPGADAAPTEPAPAATEAEVIASPVAGEYLFFAQSEEEARALCAGNGGELLYFDSGMAVMHSDSEPTTADGGTVFYPQTLYTVQSATIYEQACHEDANAMPVLTSVQHPGAGVVVAVIDSGIDLDHEALAGHIIQAVTVIPAEAYYGGSNKQYNLMFSGLENDAQDNTGHGSHIAGLIAGATEEDIYGIAPEAELFIVKALDVGKRGATGSASWIAAGILRAVEAGVDIINLSLGGTTADLVIQAAVERAASAGILVVGATGNYVSNGSNGKRDELNYPAAYEGVFAVTSAADVGGVTELSYFSKYGTGVDISAPGENIYSCNMNGGYFKSSGTSMACAYVSGAAALLLSQDPTLTADGLKRLLTATAKDAGDPGYDEVFGAGMIDLSAALAMLNEQKDESKPMPAGEEIYWIEKPELPEDMADGDSWLTTQQNEATDGETPLAAPALGTEQNQPWPLILKSSLLLLALAAAVGLWKYTRSRRAGY